MSPLIRAEFRKAGQEERNWRYWCTSFYMGDGLLLSNDIISIILSNLQADAIHASHSWRPFHFYDAPTSNRRWMLAVFEVVF